jgi:hypothetical protein
MISHTAALVTEVLTSPLPWVLESPCLVTLLCEVRQRERYKHATRVWRGAGGRRRQLLRQRLGVHATSTECAISDLADRARDRGCSLHQSNNSLVHFPYQRYPLERRQPLGRNADARWFRRFPSACHCGPAPAFGA